MEPMRRLCRGLGVLCCWLCLEAGWVSAVWPQQAQAAPVATSTAVIGAAFGLLAPGAEAGGPVQLTNQVPLAVGQRYGWSVVLKTSKRRLKFREEFVLPQTPASWGPTAVQGQLTLAEQGRMAITEREVAPVNGMIHHEWTVVAGDPVGPYQIRVYIEGQLAATFDFTVQ